MATPSAQPSTAQLPVSLSRQVKFVKADVHCPVSTCPHHLYTPPPPPPPPLLLLLLLVVFNIDEFVGIYCSPSVRPSVRQAKPSSNLLRRTGGDHRGGRAQPG